MEENTRGGSRKLWDKKPQSCSQTGCRTCCPKRGDRWKPGDYCSSPSWVTPLGYSKAAFHVLPAKPPHTKAENKSLKGVHHPQTPLWRFPSQHSLQRMDSLLNSVTQDLCSTLYIARPLQPFPDLQLLVVSDCNPYLTKTSGDKKWEFNRELHTLLKISIIISTIVEKFSSIKTRLKILSIQ